MDTKENEDKLNELRRKYYNNEISSIQYDNELYKLVPYMTKISELYYLEHKLVSSLIPKDVRLLTKEEIAEKKKEKVNDKKDIYDLYLNTL